MHLRLLSLAALLLLVLPLLGGSCDEAARRYPISLEQEVFTFHQLLKNKKFVDAAQFVREDLRGKFLDQWRRAETMMEVQEVEVTRVQKSPDVTYAQVDARLTYVMSNSLTVKQHKLFELWKGVGKTWEIDAELRPPPELLPYEPPQPEAPVTPGGDGFGGTR